MSDFLWRVDVKGYRWANVVAISEDGRNGKRGRFLVSESALSPGDALVRAYDPLEDTALFRRFLDVDGTEEGIKRFADKFGPLGGPVAKAIAVPTGGDGDPDNLTTGETLTDWVTAIQIMKRASQIWDWVIGRNVEELSRHVLWGSNEDGDYISYFDKPMVKNQKPSMTEGYALIAHSAVGGEAVIDRMAHGDLIAPATLLVRDLVNEQLKWAARPYMVEAAHLSRSRVSLKPTGLLGALWLQFTYAVENGYHFRRCDHCQAWFRYEPGRGRFPRQYCSQAHKVAAHRLAKKAISLKQEGLSPSAVAKRLGVAVERIRAMEPK